MSEPFNKNFLNELDYYSRAKDNRRNSARIRDHFQMTYRRISPADLALLKKHYMLFPTSERVQEQCGDEKDRSTNCRAYQAVCADLSGVGVRIITSEKLSEGDFIDLIIAPKMAKKPFAVQTAGEVKRVSVVNTENETYYCSGLCFLAIHEIDREKITSYTFEIQQRILCMKRQIRDNTDF